MEVHSYGLVLLVENPFARTRLRSRDVSRLERAFGSRLNHVVGDDRVLISGLLDGADEADTLVIVSGGDGTVRRVLPLVVGTERTMCVIATGTCNDLARAMGIHKVSVKSLIRRIELRRVRRIDAFSVNSQLGTTVCGFGERISLILRTIDGLRAHRSYARLSRIVGSHLYSLSTILLTVARGRMPGIGVPCELAVQPSTERPFHHDVLSELFVCNQPRLARFYAIAPNTRLTDGMLHASAVRPLPFLDTIALYLRTAVSHLPARQGVRSWKSRSLELKTAESVDFFIDGEVALQDSHFHIIIMPKSIKVVS